MKNKKGNLILYIIIFLVVLLGAFLIYKLAFNDNEEETKLINIKVSELEKKINSNETFILVISQTGCNHCNQYLPELDRTLKAYNINAYVLNITGLDSNNLTILNHYVTFSGTPTTIFFNNGIEKTALNRIIGYASKNKIVERLKSLGFID